ncbi:MAG: hypothetical protein ABI981_04175 [Betaproteobacteria bacterium]
MKHAPDSLSGQIERLATRARSKGQHLLAGLENQNRWQDAAAVISKKVHGWPMITFVVVGNGNLYGGDFRRRLAATLEWNLGRTGGRAIYVEWNPSADAPLEAPWLVERFPQLDVYVVSPKKHQQLSTNPNIPAMEFFAKNVGIRRATTPWIGVVNADVALGPDLIAHLPLVHDPSTAYGGNSASISWDGEPLTEALLLDPARRVSASAAHPSLLGYCGNFLLAHRDAWHRARGYDEKLTAHRAGCDDHAMLQLHALGIRTRILGTRYEFEDLGSWKHGPRPHHGHAWDFRAGVPYRNADDWGLANARQALIGERTWWLE